MDNLELNEEGSSSSKMDENQKEVVVMSSSVLPREKWCMNEDLYNFRGFWFLETYLDSTKRVLQDFKPRPKDVILASFPKTGTTWLKALLHSIITHNTNNSCTTNNLMSHHPHHLVQSLETAIYLPQSNILANPNHLDHKDPTSGRLLATHLPYQILGDILQDDSSGCKIVYLTRNPKDALVSFWHFVQTSEAFRQDPWELEFAADQFQRGVVPFGPYYEHVLGYRRENLRAPEKVFFLTYEELKEDPKKHVVRLAEFMGLDKLESVDAEGIVDMCSFETLSKQKVNKSHDVLQYQFPFPRSSFFRKGEVGDYRNYLESCLVDKIDGVTREKFHGVGFEYGI